MENLSPALLDVAGRPETVVFVGSGISTWSGLPTWRQLLEKLVARLMYLNQTPDLVRRELDNNDLLQAASYGFDKLTQQQKSEFLRETCLTGAAQPAEIHELIMSWGNSCYMTTNYDNLLEQAIRQHRPGDFFDVVTPSQDWEVAALLQARATRFIFKPHGDIGDTAKIVLTREDYGSLKNLRSNVFGAYRMLLASRPVIYLGFGLRDPDFLLLKESIAADFGGSPQDHYAIMPDISADEQDYWRRNYGIHLVSYETDRSADNPSDRHKPLLELLREVGSRLSSPSSNAGATGSSSPGAPLSETPKSDDALAVARHARRLRTRYSSDTGATSGILPITLTCDRDFESPFSVWALHKRVAPEALTTFVGKCIIDGAPGAGKTFAIEGAVTRRAKILEDACLESTPSMNDSQIPIYASLNQYDGDIFASLEDALPSDLSFQSLYSAGRLAIFLDAYNEIPAHHIESGRASEDIRGLIDSAGDNTLVVTTRFANDLKDLGLPSAHLDEIDEAYVIDRLKESVPDSTHLNAGIVQVLQRPMFFQQFIAGVIEPGSISNVHDVYSQLLEHYSQRASNDLAVKVELEEALSFVGYQMIESGDLTLGIADLHAQLKRSLPPEISPSELVSWLLKVHILIALPRKRVIFFHHSLPEYFAAHRLSRLYTSDSSAPEACFGKRRWDQALLLALGFLERDDAKKLMERIFDVDTRMGLRSLNYIETDRVAWTNYALQILLKLDSDSDMSRSAFFDHELDGLLLTQESLPYMWKLVDAGNSIGGSAAAKIWAIGNSDDREVLTKHISTRFDYNYLNRFMEGIADLISQEEALLFLSEANSIRQEEGEVLTEDHDYRAVISAVATALKVVPIEEVIQASASLEPSTLVADLVVLDRCSSDNSVHALQYLIDAVIREIPGADFTLYLQLMFHTSDAESLALLQDKQLASGLLSLIHESAWVVKCIIRIVSLVPDWANHLPIKENMDDRVEVAVWQLIRGDRVGFMKLMNDLCSDGYGWTEEGLTLLGRCEVDWAEYEDLLVQLLFGGDIEVSLAVGQTSDIRHSPEAHMMRRHQIPNLRAFIDRVSAIGDDRWDERQDLLWLTGHLVDEDGREQLKEILVSGPIKHRRLVAHEVLRHAPGFTLDELPAETIDWLIGDLECERDFPFVPNILDTASEGIVSEKLLPLLLEGLEPRARRELLKILRTAGRRHDRRYVDKEGELLL